MTSICTGHDRLHSVHHGLPFHLFLPVPQGPARHALPERQLGPPRHLCSGCKEIFLNEPSVSSERETGFSELLDLFDPDPRLTTLTLLTFFRLLYKR